MITHTTVFEPSDKDMRAEYPELSEYIEFNTIRNLELRFVWYYGCKSSPIIGLSERDRLVQSLKLSKLESSLDEKQRLNYHNSRFPDTVIAAINKMRTFQPTIRSRAKHIMSTMLDNVEKMVFVSEEQLKEMDVAEKTKYAALVNNVTNFLPDVVKRVEDGFAVKEIMREDSKRSTLMDRSLENGNTYL